MLTPAERKELDKLSPTFKARLLKMFGSPYMDGYLAMKSQYEAYCQEFRETPFTINSEVDIDKLRDLPNADKIITSMESMARSKADTSLKISLALPELAKKMEEMKALLLPDEKAALTNSAKDLRKEALG
jgi:hypothetical protein